MSALPDAVRVLFAVLLVALGLWIMKPNVHRAILQYFVDLDSEAGRRTKPRSHRFWIYMASVVAFTLASAVFP